MYLALIHQSLFCASRPAFTAREGEWGDDPALTRDGIDD